MYIPRHHEETNLTVLHSLIVAHPLGTWATSGVDELIVNHVPFVLDASRADNGTLMGHIARANPVWNAFSRTIPSVVVFQGAESYISPSWYPSKRAHGKAVPTWNYAVVHAHGIPVVIDDKTWLLNHLNRLTEVHEADQTLPWSLSDAPADYIERMLEAIVGIEIPISKLIGKWKVSQNRSESDKLGVIAGLRAKSDSRAVEMAELIGQTDSGANR
jgi:transcriptional regulator